jgi:hypothetical protein
MTPYTLHHMYQAWCQEQEDPERDWSHFVEWAAKWNNTTGDHVMRVLQTTYWFKMRK